MQQQDREQHALPIAPDRYVAVLAANLQWAKDSIVQSAPPYLFASLPPASQMTQTMADVAVQGPVRAP